MSEPDICWRLHLASSPDKVYDALDSDDGRARFWAESAVEADDGIRFRFPSGIEHTAPVVDRARPERWCIRYFGATTTFELRPDGSGGTDLELTASGADRGASATDLAIAAT